MYRKMYSPENGPFPPHVEAPKAKLHKTGLHGGNDIAYSNGFIYVIDLDNGGTLRICTADEKEPKVLSCLGGFGNTRQIEVSDCAVSGRVIAAITARECGLYLVDVTDPYKPFVCCHYNSVEFATGVGFCGNYLFVGCRSFGVEILDVSSPEKPGHISVIRAGEVQSVYVDNGILYTGSWGERKVNVFDVRDTADPKRLASIPLEGRGDGICVRDGLLYAAFGQHLVPASGNDPSEYGYGRGNGFAVWDVRDPGAPRQISVILFPIRFFAHWDLWDVTLCGDFAVISHTMNGVWIYDVSDPSAPRLTDHLAIVTEAKLPDLLAVNEFTTDIQPFNFPFDPAKIMYAPVTGVAAANGRLYIAAKFANLHIAHADYFTDGRPPRGELGRSDICFYDRYGTAACDGVKTARVGGQVHAAAYLDGYIYAACGMDGIRVFDTDLNFIGSLPTDSFCMDIRESHGLLYAAVNKAGVLILRPSMGELTVLGCYFDGESTFAQAVPSDNGRFLMVHTNDDDLTVLDVSDPTDPKRVMFQHYEPGLIYHRQITHTGVGGRFWGCFWNNNYTRWYDLSGDVPRLTEYMQGRLGFVEGITGMPEDNLALVTNRKGYCIHDIRNELDYGRLEYIPVEGIPHFSGKPVVSGDRLYVSNRLNGNVYICDISDRKAPKLIRLLNFSGHPDLVCPTPFGAVIPLGHQGLAVVKHG